MDYVAVIYVSTHAPLAGSDVRRSAIHPSFDEVSTHAPLAGSDEYSAASYLHTLAFQPTLPLRGVTLPKAVVTVVKAVSTHAPLAGSDFFSIVTLA